MIKINLREMMKMYREKTGARITYLELSELTGLSVTTLQSIGARPDYNTSLFTIAKICEALDCEPGELLTREKSE